MAHTAGDPVSPQVSGTCSYVEATRTVTWEGGLVNPSTILHPSGHVLLDFGVDGRRFRVASGIEGQTTFTLTSDKTPGVDKTSVFCTFRGWASPGYDPTTMDVWNYTTANPVFTGTGTYVASTGVFTVVTGGAIPAWVSTGRIFIRIGSVGWAEISSVADPNITIFTTTNYTKPTTDITIPIDFTISQAEVPTSMNTSCYLADGLDLTGLPMRNRLHPIFIDANNPGGFINQGDAVAPQVHGNGPTMTAITPWHCIGARHFKAGAAVFWDKDANGGAGGRISRSVVSTSETGVHPVFTLNPGDPFNQDTAVFTLTQKLPPGVTIYPILGMIENARGVSLRTGFAGNPESWKTSWATTHPIIWLDQDGRIFYKPSIKEDYAGAARYIGGSSVLSGSGETWLGNRPFWTTTHVPNLYGNLLPHHGLQGVRHDSSGPMFLVHGGKMFLLGGMVFSTEVANLSYFTREIVQHITNERERVIAGETGYTTPTDLTLPNVCHLYASWRRAGVYGYMKHRSTYRKSL